jgi:hypothetical protein
MVVTGMGRGRRALPGGRWRLIGLVVAVGQPLLLVGTAAVVARLGTYPGGAGTGVLQSVLTVLVGLLWLASIALDAHPFALFLGGVAGLVALTAVFNGAEAAALHERSERTSCAVASVTERIEYSAYLRPDAGDFPAQWPNPPMPPPMPDPAFDHFDDFDDHDTPTTWYDYRLTCASGPVTGASWTSRPAEVGNRLDIVYDPLQLVGPVPAADYTDSDGAAELTTAVVGTGIMIAFRVAGTLWFSWYGFGMRPWRRRRRRGRW